MAGVWTRQGDRNARATLLMFAAVVGYSLIPLFIAWGGESHFAFNAGWRLGAIAGCASFLSIFYRDLICDTRVWTAVRRRATSPLMLLWVIAFFDLPLYALAVQFINVSIPAMLFEVRMVFVIFLTSRLFRGQRRYRRITFRSILLIALAFMGVSAVITSQTGGWGSGVEFSPGRLALGVSLALGAAALTSMTALGFRWGTDLAGDLLHHPRYQEDDLELFGIVVGIIISSTLSVVITMPLSFGYGQGFPVESIVYGAGGGVVIGTFSAIGWRKANLLIRNLAINVLVYMSPVLAILWMFAFGLIDDVSLGYLMFGAAMIIMANVGIFFEVEGGPQGGRQYPEGGPDLSAYADMGESDTLEFKSTLRCNLLSGRNERAIEDEVVSTVAALLNSEGGVILIGVADDGSAVGVETDTFQSEDRMGLHLRNIVIRNLGPVAMAHAHPVFGNYQGLRVLAVHCDRASQPIFFRDRKGEKFYVRAGASTTALPTSNAVEYIRKRF